MMGQGMERVMKLNPIERTFNTPIFDKFYTDLFVYSENNMGSSTFQYNKGVNGIVVTRDMLYHLTIGDIISISINGCE